MFKKRVKWDRAEDAQDEATKRFKESEDKEIVVHKQEPKWNLALKSQTC